MEVKWMKLYKWKKGDGKVDITKDASDAAWVAAWVAVDKSDEFKAVDSKAEKVLDITLLIKRKEVLLKLAQIATTLPKR